MWLVVSLLCAFLFYGFSDPISIEDEDDRFNITVVAMFQFTDSYYDREYIPGVVLETAVELACEDIANTDNLLDGYRINLQAVNSNCDVGTSAWQLAENVLRPNEPVVVIGPGCETPAYILGRMTNPRNNVITVGHKSRGTALNEYNHFFTTVAPNTELNKAVYSLLVKFNWKHICILIQGDDRFIRLAEHFTSYLTQNSMSFVILHSVTERNPEYLVDSYCRVFVVFADEWIHPWVSCEMHRLNLTGQYYQTIFIGNVLTEQIDWIQEYCPINLTESAPSTIAVHFRNTLYDNTGGEPHAFEKRLRDELLRTYNYDFSFDYEIAAAAYDATWAIAYGLNSSIDALAQRNLKLEDYLPQSASDVAEVIIEQFEKVSFQGVYKTINFTADQHFPQENIIISQFQEGMYVPVSMYSDVSKELTDYENASYMWLGLTPPSDRPLVVIVDFTNYSVYIVSITILGLAMCLFFFVFNCYFRNEKLIKASSPYINNIIILGCALNFASISIYALENSRMIPVTVRDYMCNATVWFIFCGFSLSFGALTIKTWRVYRVFRNPWSNRRIYRDSSLILIIFGLLGVDIFFLVLMSAIAPLRSTEMSINTTEYTYEYLLCDDNSQFSGIFINVLLIYKVLILALAGFLAIQTRKIKSKAFNDSKWITITIYLTIFAALFGIPVALISALTGYWLVAYISIVVLLTLQGLIISLTLFLPKLFVLKKTRNTATLIVSDTGEPTKHNVKRRTSDYYRPKMTLRTIDSTTVILEETVDESLDE